ncbi:DsrE/DsrF/DrsH-like family protein [Rhizorhapis suberifaciens]|uniref:Putative peroxiredoxin n=1 Tax=Rhizorhapis suberifaciens TaxID=13656 RepID=A0A840HZP7_9SPHN|nr:DsrE/DsrF/DrsH-like family protein [Rhizorhapis suberifaciens]MBB4642886.1 putative peroxiredoxin [Rhizorhapis suberifaciens]
MRNLKLVILTPDPERVRGALTIAAAQAALGAEVTIFCQLEAAALLRQPFTAPNDTAHQVKGLPTLDDLMSDAAGLGVRFIACQSGMELCGMEASDLAPHSSTGGPVSFLQTVEDGERLLII